MTASHCSLISFSLYMNEQEQATEMKQITENNIYIANLSKIYILYELLFNISKKK